MAKTKNPALLRRRERVRAAADLVGVPAGTAGQVMLSNGIDWVRYWVRFDNGAELGSLHRDKLVRLAEWDRWQAEQVARAERAAAAASEPAAGGEGGGEISAGGDGGDGGAAGGSGEAVTVNGVTIPPHLLDRTKSALSRLGVSR